MKRTLGVCYYPEHWPEAMWAGDARRMREMGLTWVRIGEFAWRRIEHAPGRFDWGWLDRAIDTLEDAGLQVILGTPTATPPRWMVDRHPDMLAHDADGRPRGFGSRRHYCFSHEGYLTEAVRITQAVAERYGARVAAWQTDNEYGCHDTTISYSPAARTGFQRWLADRYGTIEALNAAWGNVFWSMEYDRFDQIEPPNLTVTEPNPAHAFDFRRFSSDQVVHFNRAQVQAIRAHSAAPILHNYMGRVTDFDHFDVGADLEIAGWDSYPMGFLEDRVGADPDTQRAYACQGDPDFQAFHHDLYRAVGRLWVVEQQPGPVNWAPHNPAPLPGMVRLWTWEAFAHGAETVCYFRWRQAPFAQEQLHAGLLRPDSTEAPGAAEAAEVAAELAAATDIAPTRAPVALMFDYAAEWAWSVQPHGAGLSYFDIVFAWYRALRKLGQSIDIVPPTATELAEYDAVFVPGLMHMPTDLKQQLASIPGHVVLGPRTAARVETFSIPVPLPPTMPGWDLRVTHVESLRTDTPKLLCGGGTAWGYFEHLEGSGERLLELTCGAPFAVRHNNLTYVAGIGDPMSLDRLFSQVLEKQNVSITRLPNGLRCRDTATERFWFNYAATEVSLDGRVFPAASVIRDVL